MRAMFFFALQVRLGRDIDAKDCGFFYKNMLHICIIECILGMMGRWLTKVLQAKSQLFLVWTLEKRCYTKGVWDPSWPRLSRGGSQQFSWGFKERVEKFWFQLRIFFLP